jgi:adenylate cyclase class IV
MAYNSFKYSLPYGVETSDVLRQISAISEASFQYSYTCLERDTYYSCRKGVIDPDNQHYFIIRHQSRIGGKHRQSESPENLLNYNPITDEELPGFVMGKSLYQLIQKTTVSLPNISNFVDVIKLNSAKKAHHVEEMLKFSQDEFVYIKKERTIGWIFGNNVRIHIDKTENFGNFIEFEVKNPQFNTKIIENVASKLGLSQNKVTESYFKLSRAQMLNKLGFESNKIDIFPSDIINAIQTEQAVQHSETLIKQGEKPEKPNAFILTKGSGKVIENGQLLHKQGIIPITQEPSESLFTPYIITA